MTTESVTLELRFYEEKRQIDLLVRFIYQNILLHVHSTNTVIIDRSIILQGLHHRSYKGKAKIPLCQIRQAQSDAKNSPPDAKMPLCLKIPLSATRHSHLICAFP
jgi:hypothetical protein